MIVWSIGRASLTVKMENCIVCGKELTALDIGAHKKFINRGSREYMCKTCLSEHLKVPEELLDQKIEHFRRQGCTLFSKNDLKVLDK